MTYAELKARIATLMRRSDLTTDIANEVAERIKHYQRYFFSGSPVTVTPDPLVVGRTVYTLPAQVGKIDRLRYLSGSVYTDVSKDEYETLLDLDTISPSTQGQPTLWAPFGDQFRVYPAPDQAYSIEITGPGKISAPTSDSASNWWTTDGASLLIFATAAELYQQVLNAPDRALALRDSANRVLLGLQRETRLRTARGVIAPHWGAGE